MRRIINLSEFPINERLVSDGWPANWKDSYKEEWKSLQDLGFTDSTTAGQARNQSIMLSNNRIDLYPSGIVLQKSGYIRDYAKDSGFIRRYGATGDAYSLKDLLDYLIDKYAKEAKKRTRKETHGPISDQALSLLFSSIKTSNWKWNPSTERIDVNGNVDLIQKIDTNEKLEALYSLRFGKIKGDFNCSWNSIITSLPFAPTYVSGLFNCSQCEIKSLAGSPIEVGQDFYCNSNMLESLENGPKKVGGNYRAGSIYAWDDHLKSLKGVADFIGGFFSTPVFYIPDGEWNLESKLHVLSGESFTTYYEGAKWAKIEKPEVRTKAQRLMSTILTNDVLDKYFKENPLELYLLDPYPKIKDDVLKRTGIKDMSHLGRALKKGMI